MQYNNVIKILGIATIALLLMPTIANTSNAVQSTQQPDLTKEEFKEFINIALNEPSVQEYIKGKNYTNRL